MVVVGRAALVEIPLPSASSSASAKDRFDRKIYTFIRRSHRTVPRKRDRPLRGLVLLHTRFRGVEVSALQILDQKTDQFNRAIPVTGY